MSEQPVLDTQADAQSKANSTVPEEAQDAKAASAAAVAGLVVSPKVSLFPHIFAIFLIAAMAISMLASLYLWRKLSNIQEQLARQSLEATTLSVEARTMAKNAQDVAREAAARVVVNETRLSEVALQRSQLDELMQSLSRSRDENLVVDIESALRLAQQQAQLTGSVAPLLAALKTADLRLARAAQPRLNAVRRALASDTDRIKAAAVTDIPSLLAKLDELTRLINDLPVINAVATVSDAEKARTPSATSKNPKADDAAALKQDASWQTRWSNLFLSGWGAVRVELLKLVRVSRIEHPDAALLSPEQTFFLRENLKLKLLNVRLGLLSRQMQSATADLASASVDMHKYVDPTAKSSQVVFALLQQVQSQLGNVAIPGLDDSLSALTLAVAGR